MTFWKTACFHFSLFTFFCEPQWKPFSIVNFPFKDEIWWSVDAYFILLPPPAVHLTPAHAQYKFTELGNSRWSWKEPPADAWERWCLRLLSQQLGPRRGENPAKMCQMDVPFSCINHLHTRPKLPADSKTLFSDSFDYLNIVYGPQTTVLSPMLPKRLSNSPVITF